MIKNKLTFAVLSALLLLAQIAGCSLPADASAIQEQLSSIIETPDTSEEKSITYTPSAAVSTLTAIPAYNGSAYVAVNGNVPYFTDAEMSADGFESYSDLDSLGRCGTASASVGPETMPTEDRGEIGSVKPSGWQSVKYDIVDGKYLYNRCHLIGYQLTAENANEKNLITGTRFLNIEGMLPFENMVADYVKETGNHVMYRVTPVFEGDNLVASGVLMEGKSVEDDGEGILYCVYCYNVQPGINIDYATGASYLDSTSSSQAGTQENGTEETYILNKNSKKFHYPSCSSAGDISEDNRAEYTGSRQDLIDKGYEPCGRCHP